MATESAVRISEGTDKWPSLRHSTRYRPSSAIEDLGLFLRGQSFRSVDMDVIPSRSGSAPPSMEGSIAAIEGIFSRQRVTPGVPYPSFSTVNRETELKFHANSSPDVKHATSFGLVPKNNLPAHAEESEDDQSSEQSASISVEKAPLLGYHSSSLDSTQEYSHRASSPSYDQFLSISNKSMDERVFSVADSLHSISISTSSVGTNTPSLEDAKQVSSLDGTGGIGKRPPIHDREGNAEKVDTPDSLSVVGVSDIDSAYSEDGKIVDVPSASNKDSQKFHKKEQFIPQYEVPQHQSVPQESNTPQAHGSYSRVIYPGITFPYGNLNHLRHGSLRVSAPEVQPLLHSSGFTPPVYATAAPLMTSPTPYYFHMQPAGFFTPQYNTGGYYFSPGGLHSYMAGYPPHGAVPLAFSNASFPTSGVSGGNIHAYNVQNLQKFYGQVGFPLQHSFAGHSHPQYVQPAARESSSTHTQFDPQTPRDDDVVTQMKLRSSQKVAEPHNPQNYNNLNTQRGNVPSHYFLGSPSNAVFLPQFPAASGGSVLVEKPAAGTSFSGGRNSSTSRGTPNKDYGVQGRSQNDMNSYSFLEELKSGNGQRFELSDIHGHIGEFSVDQHGSRFIQQRLETCSIEEKASVLKEVIPHASKLMTDVFGNYVVQKLFDYGSSEQRKELANQLEGNILTLSLQMYGCRVIQKALEVIDLEQKARLVRELDGNVVRCVRDQNGNHVIQKCIESIPGDTIHFIISSFRGQVATLAMHPYGCRVIQRVLEHCSDELQTQFIVDEILDSVCSLAQDQYGNYVTQHVLERGKPRERSEIIQKLGRSIVKLSQHKFASNVVEKCLEYSDSTARDMLIKEIVGHGDKNDNLLIMMKDQYANYVIQKILQKCTGDQREMLLGLIRNHLTALKKYTYGKHIVTRFEQLCDEEIQTSGS